MQLSLYPKRAYQQCLVDSIIGWILGAILWNIWLKEPSRPYWSWFALGFFFMAGIFALMSYLMKDELDNIGRINTVIE